MKRKYRAAVAAGSIFLLAIAITMVILMQVTYSEQQLLRAGQNYLGQQGGDAAECDLIKTSWYNDDLFCLYQAGEIYFVIGFSKSNLLPQRYYSICKFFPEKEEETEQGQLYDFSFQDQRLYTYVLFGRRPKGIREIDVEVLDEDNSRVSQYHYKIRDEEDKILYVLQKYDDHPLHFQYSLCY